MKYSIGKVSGQIMGTEETKDSNLNWFLYSSEGVYEFSFRYIMAKVLKYEGEISE